MLKNLVLPLHIIQCNMADTEKSKTSAPPSSPSSKRSEYQGRKRFFPTEQIPRLSHTDPLANELISQEVIA